MKLNMPITDIERQLSDGTTLITTTDLKGRVSSANQAFVAISGFSEEELVGANHNIVRHPDMPKEAFGNLWDKLKEGSPWNGLVKNRTKSGDYYWVDAFVAPIHRDGEIIGYQSVRTQANREHVKRADMLYGKIRGGKMPWQLKHRILYRHKLAAALFFLVVLNPLLGLAFSALSLQQAAGELLMLTPIAALLFWRLASPVKHLERKAKAIVDNPLTDFLYTGRNDEFGTIENSSLMLTAKLRTALGRIDEFSSDLQLAAQQTTDAVGRTNEAVVSQKSELDAVATIMHELNATAHEVASNVVRTADASKKANEISQDGAERIAHAIGVIENLANKVRGASGEMEKLDQYSAEIGTVLDVIRGIAEQTNLLALNAAIEAARAGEQGRGFAVVADEVRTLASRTQQSTTDIHQMIERLQSGAHSAMAAIRESEALANQSEEEIEKTAEAIAVINGEVSEISNQNTQVASASEEQTKVLEEVEQNIVNINMAAEETAGTAKELSVISESFSEMACSLRILVNQCRV